MAKTAMQELIEWLDKQAEYQNDTMTWKKINDKATKLLKLEKEQITQSYKDGKHHERYGTMSEINLKSEDYYNKTYTPQL